MRPRPTQPNEAAHCYGRASAVRQPHSQPVCRQRQESFWQPQEQVAQSQAPQQEFWFAFSVLDIDVLPF